MSTTNDPGTNLDKPFAPVPDVESPERALIGKEVFAPANVPFEAPAEHPVAGPYYMGVEERLPELAERTPAEIVELTGVKAEEKKFPVDRRDFMKLFSASAVMATSACVQRPVEKAIPYVQQPIDQFPGEPVFYASTCGDCAAGCGIMVKTREGRPTKIEGLPGHPISNGRLCAVGQAGLQGLWHPERQAQPIIRFGNKLEKSTWDDTYEHLGAVLGKTVKVGILTNGATGHRHEFFREFLEKTGSNASRLYTYDSNQLGESIVAAHKLAYGLAVMPRADLEAARTIVGVGSDFLDVGTNLLYHTRGYTESHAFKGTDKKGRHVQFESNFTLTGAKADERFVIPPGTETLTTLLLVRALLKNSGSKGSSASRGQIQQVLDQKADAVGKGYQQVGVPEEAFDKLAGELLAAPSVVMAGGLAFDENATNLQLAAIMANELLGAYDSVLHLQKGWMPAAVQPGDLQRFLTEARDLDVLFVIDADPVFELPQAWGMSDVLKAIPNLVTISDFPTETSELASHRLNANHWLESWGDEQSVAGLWSIRQPTVRPTTDSRQTEDILMWLAAKVKKPLGYENYRDYLKKKWAQIRTLNGRTNIPEDMYFEAVLREGFDSSDQTQAVAGLSQSLAANFKYVNAGSGGLKLIAPLDFRLRDGRHAHKPVLQETPDTLTTITWDTWVAINPTTASKLGFRKFDVIRVEGVDGNHAFEASLYPLPGLHPDAVVVPRGNGHAKGSGIIQGGNGVNPLVAFDRKEDQVTRSPVTSGQAVKLTATGKVMELAQLQKHNDIANRKDIVKKVSLAKAVEGVGKTQDLDDVPDLFPALPKKEHRWGMSIDLTKCTGCQSCVTACFTENNVPQVGREQIMMGRGMHWIKIDRYFYGSTDTPEVSLQPMLCQHCMQAPCEAVCPVLATSHDPEGINTMTYNRCIGTRYCANACPYKIRRFNWWTHKWNTVGERLQDRNPRAMNPDVTVRTRGVMEKCTFCYQRVRDARHREKIQHIPVGQKGNIVLTACQQTCPADAITFGNLLDPNAEAAQLRKDHRAYLALGGNPEEKEYGLKTLPNVSYLAQVLLHESEPEQGEKTGHMPAGQGT